MLQGLIIRDMLIIDQLELQFQPGLNVLTGETGAGKSILLDCLGFVLGWRGRTDLVRLGAEQGEVIAWFDIPVGHPVNKILIESGFDLEPELILRRTNTKEGRKTSFVNDRRCSGQVLRLISETLLELHGQHDDRGLLDVREHMKLLDTHSNSEPLRDSCRAAWKLVSQRQSILTVMQDKILALKKEEDYLRYTVSELELLDVSPGDDAALDAHRRFIKASEKIRVDVDRALEALSINGAEGLINDASRWVESAADQLEGQLNGASEVLNRTLNNLGEAQQEIERVLGGLKFNPAELDYAEDRLFSIRAAARKYSVTPDELSTLAAEMGRKLASLDDGETGLISLQEDLDSARLDYRDFAAKLHEARIVGARVLDAEMESELAPLKMERATFKTKITPISDSVDGSDMVEFTVATNPGAPSGPLQKIASGGELSRFLLALKVCLSGGDTYKTMIFDEIDRGVGGATADAVGRRLAELGSDGQVLVVTHSPQVAALGSTHWRVEKRVVGDMTLSSVVSLSKQERIDEIARMLAGNVVTDAARDAAKSLLKPV